MEKNSQNFNQEEFRSCLKKHGLKLTPQRKEVHEAMLSLGHASADMVAEKIHERGKVKVTIASVYNILSQMSALGIYAHRLSIDNKMYFDVNTFGHIHLYDTVNHTFTDVPDEALYKEIGEKLLPKRFKGYKIDGLDIQILAHPNTRSRK